MERFRRPGWAVVADLAAGTRQPMFGWASFASHRVVVVEPSAKSILTANRLMPVATHAVINKVRCQADLDLVREAISLPILGAIPYDESVAEAERLGIPPIDFAPQSPAIRAAGEIVARLEEIA
jgi:CO dehydrogenase maturation factor